MYGNNITATMLMYKSNDFKMKLNSKDIHGKTAFYLVCSHGHANLVTLILMKHVEFDIKLDSEDNFGETAFDHAFKIQDKNIFALLKQKSAELKSRPRDKQGKKAFHFACMAKDIDKAQLIMKKYTQFTTLT